MRKACGTDTYRIGGYAHNEVAYPLFYMRLTIKHHI